MARATRTASIPKRKRSRQGPRWKAACRWTSGARVRFAPSSRGTPFAYASQIAQVLDRRSGRHVLRALIRLLEPALNVETES